MIDSSSENVFQKLTSKKSPKARSMRRSGVRWAAAIAAGLTAGSAQAANAVHTVATGTNNYSTATWSPVGVPNAAGDIIQNNGNATVTTVDTSVTIGVIRNALGSTWTLSAGAGTLTMDGTGLTSGNSPFGIAGQSAIANTTNVTNGLVVNANISIANTDLNIGLTNTQTTLIGGTITATTAQNLNIRTNGNGLFTASGAIGTSGSNIAIFNLGTGAGSATLSGNLGASVTSITQNATNSALILSGNNSNFAGTVALQAGTLHLNSVTALGGTGAGGTFTITGGNLTNSSGGAITLVANNAMAWNGDFGYLNTATTNINLGTGAVTLGGNRTLTSTGAGSLTIGGIIGGAFNLTKAGSSGGALILTGNNTTANSGYTGLTTVNGGTLQVSGAAASIASSSGLTISGNGVAATGSNTSGLFILDKTSATAADSLNNSGAINISTGGEFQIKTTTNSSPTETVGNIIVGTGASVITVNPPTTGVLTLASTGSLSRTGNGTALLRGTNIAQNSSTTAARITVVTGPSGADFVGTNTLNNGNTTDTTQALKIVPWLFADNTVGGVGDRFVTYDSTLGFRGLLQAEMTTLVAGSTTVVAAPINAVAFNGTVSTANLTVNSLLFNGGTQTLNGSGILTINSGALAQTTNGTIDSGWTKILFGNDQAIITTAAGTTGMTINTPIDVTNGGGLIKTGAGTGPLILTAANLYTGQTIVNQGTLTVGNGTTGSLASGSGAVTVFGGATFALNRPTGDTFANDVASAGTFNITNNGTQTLSGNITGAGGGTFTTIASGKTLILSGTANTYSNATSLTGTLQFNAGSTSGVSGASSANSAITMASGATLQLRGDGNATFNTGTITMPSDISAGSDTTSFNFDVGQASSGSNKTLTLGTLTFNTGTAGNRGNDVQTINLTGTTGYTLAITNAIGANSNGQVGQNYQYNVASGLTLSVLGGLNSGIGGSHIFLGAGNTIVGTLTRAANRAFNVFVNGTGTVTFNNAVTNGGGSGNYGTGLNAGTTVFNDVNAVNGVQINLGNQTVSSTDAATFLLGGSTGLNGGLTFGSTVRPYDTTSGLLTIGGQNTSGTNTYTAGMQLGNTGNTGKSVNLVAATGGEVDFTNAITKNGTDTTAGLTINGAYTVNGATVNPAGIIKLSGASTYSGPTTVSAGTLKAGVVSVANVSGAFGNNTAMTIANVASAKLDITGFNTQIGSLTGGGTTGGNVTLGAAILTTGGDNTSPAAYAGVISGTGGLTKIGTGNQTLSGANTYTGNTTISAGTLLVNNSLASGNVSVAASATLGGNGTLSGKVITANNTSVISPGNSPGTLTVASLDASLGARFKFELGSTDATNVSDQLVVTGALTAPGGTGGLVLDINAWGFDPAGPKTGVVYTLITFGSQTNLTDSDFNTIVLGTGLVLDTTFGSSDVGNANNNVFVDGSSVQVEFSAVPEPTSLSFLGLGVGGLLARRKRRSKLAATVVH